MSQRRHRVVAFPFDISANVLNELRLKKEKNLVKDIQYFSFWEKSTIGKRPSHL